MESNQAERRVDQVDTKVECGDHGWFYRIWIRIHSGVDHVSPIELLVGNRRSHSFSIHSRIASYLVENGLPEMFTKFRPLCVAWMEILGGFKRSRGGFKTLFV